MSVTKRKQQSFLHGAGILVGATMLVKMIGAVFKIPVNNLLGGVGAGYFNSAYDLYLPLYSLAMAGLPIAISRMVAERVAQKRYRDVRKTLRIAQRAFLVTGLTGFFVMLLCAYPYILFIGNSGALMSILCITPSLLFCCVMSSYRGYYEGLRNMYPTAVSSVIEALGKLVLGLGFAYPVFLKARAEFDASGTVFGKAVEVPVIENPEEQAKAIKEAVTAAAGPYTAAAAILGITIGAALGALYLIIRHRRAGDNITIAELRASPRPIRNKQTLRIMISIAIPVVLGSLVTNVASLIDLATVQRRLVDAFHTGPDTVLQMYEGLLPSSVAGLSGDELAKEISNYLYGCYKGFAYSIYNLVPTLTSVLGVSALPALTTAWIERDRRGLKVNLESMVRTTALLALPGGVGITVLSENILNLLYAGKPREAAVAAPVLAILGFTAVFAGLTMPMTNMLQAIGKQNIPVRNMAIGAVLKIVVNFVLVGNPSLNVIGAPAGSLCCYAFIFIADLYCLLKYSGVRMNFFSTLIKPAFAAVLCGAAGWVSAGLLSWVIPKDKLVTILAICIAGLVYVISLLCTRAITREDVAMLPKGQKIAAVLAKRGWIR
ncbi:MAG: polysaccharide biosynthesis protein [Clostridiales bacterium]|nr:polysaccharide biosynthesis protein [Clostridiales bacterium]